MPASFTASVTVGATPPASAGLSAAITLQGVRSVFTQASAADLGDYIDPAGKFRMQCLKAPRAAALPAVDVWFRPDRGALRREVVVELGDVFLTPRAASSIIRGNPTTIFSADPHNLPDGAAVAIYGATYSKTDPATGAVKAVASAVNGQRIATRLSPTSFSVPVDTSAEETAPAFGKWQAWNLPAYSVEIFDGATKLATINVPKHYWFCRWRWQSEPRPIRMTPAQVAATGIVPKLDASVMGKYLANHAPQTYDIMGFSGLVTGMGWTGPRPDIGLVTGWQGNWQCNGANPATVIAHGEASGTIGMHMRDPATGAPLDLWNKYPKFTTYGQPSAGTSGLVAYDDGHDPALAIYPWLMTGDPYYLEALQFQPNFELQSNSSRYTTGGRYGAWRTRNLLYAWAASPEVPPSWLLPKSVFAAHLEAKRQWLAAAVADTVDPVHSVFRCLSFGGAQNSVEHPAGTYAAIWQDGMWSTVIMHAVKMKAPGDWLSIAKWKILGEIKLTDGVEWSRCDPSPYLIGMHYTTNLAAACGLTDTTITVDKYGAPPMPAVPFVVNLQSEKVLVTDIAHYPQWTIQRAYAGTKAAAHPAVIAVVGPKFISWSECKDVTWAKYGPIPTAPGDPTGMNKLYAGSNAERPQYQRAALALAVGLGIAEAAPGSKWIDGEFLANLKPGWGPTWGWLMAP